MFPRLRGADDGHQARQASEEKKETER